MIRYVVSRLVVSVAMVLLATLVIFLIANTVPGDPVLTALGDMAASDPVQVAEFRARWGLDLPLWQQYWLFLERLAHGDLGVSISSRRPVLQDIIDYAPATLELATVAFILSILVGLPLGVLAAVRRDTVIDHVDHVCQIAGNARHCMIGSDLDGAFGREQSPTDIETIADLARLPAHLAARGYSEEEVRGIAHGNFLRFLRGAWG